MILATHFWFKIETRFTNNSDKPITISAISRDSYGNFSVTQKNGIFPLDPSHSYNGIHLLPGQTAKLTWDWDDQIIHGFHIVDEKDHSSYMQIDFRKPEDCCYTPEKNEYSFMNSSTLTEVPGSIAQLNQFQRIDRWKSFFAWNSFALLFWGLLAWPAVFLFGRAFFRKNRSRNVIQAT